MDKLSGKTEQEKQDNATDNRKPLTEKQQKTMEVLANLECENKFEEAHKVLGLSLSTIHQHKKLAEKKGYKLEEFVK